MLSSRMHWFGAKRVVKNVLHARPINAVLVTALRRLPPNATIARMPVSLPEVEGIVAGVHYTLTNPSRCSIAKELFWGRGRRARPDEQRSLEVFTELARHSDVALDIGANTGVFSIVSALTNPDIVVEAFEILPEAYELLFRNVIRNDVGTRVRCHFTGVDTDGFSMRVPSATAYSSLPLSYSASMQSENGPMVAFRSLDTICAPLKDSTRLLVKIDVEGTEGRLFSGGWSAIRRLRPWIVCEILADVPGSAELGQRLLNEHYHIFKITDRGLEEASALVGDARHRDWLFAPRDINVVKTLVTAPVY